jgi:hypothetical protein
LPLTAISLVVGVCDGDGGGVAASAAAGASISNIISKRFMSISSPAN